MGRNLLFYKAYFRGGVRKTTIRRPQNHDKRQKVIHRFSTGLLTGLSTKPVDNFLP